MYCREKAHAMLGNVWRRLTFKLTSEELSARASAICAAPLAIRLPLRLSSVQIDALSASPMDAPSAGPSSFFDRLREHKVMLARRASAKAAPDGPSSF